MSCSPIFLEIRSDRMLLASTPAPLPSFALSSMSFHGQHGFCSTKTKTCPFYLFYFLVVHEKKVLSSCWNSILKIWVSKKPESRKVWFVENISPCISVLFGCLRLLPSISSLVNFVNIRLRKLVAIYLLSGELRRSMYLHEISLRKWKRPYICGKVDSGSSIGSFLLLFVRDQGSCFTSTTRWNFCVLHVFTFIASSKPVQ